MVIKTKTFNVSIDPCYIIGFFFFLYVLGLFASPMLGWNDYFLQIPLYLFFFCTFFFIKKYYYSVKLFIKWYIPFVIFVILSSLYTPSSNNEELIKSVIMSSVFGLSITIFLSFDKAIRIIATSYLLVSTVIGIYLISTFRQAHWWSRLGENFGMNENLVALYFIIPLCLSLFELSNKHQVGICIINILISSYIILLTGSKKALFAAIAFYFVFSILKSGKITTVMRAVLITLSIIVVLYYLVMHIQRLYDILGYRLEAMITTIENKAFYSSSNSTGERADMIRYGLKLFASSPLWGHGINSFQQLYGLKTGHYAYSHNNYVELLSNYGLIGFVLYYAIFYLLIKQIKELHGRHMVNNEVAFSIGLVFLVLIYDIAMVSYYDTRIMMLISIAYTSLLKLNNGKNGVSI